VVEYVLVWSQRSYRRLYIVTSKDAKKTSSIELRRYFSFDDSRTVRQVYTSARALCVHVHSVAEIL
jgi:hypothetical protein